jgi:hypothetical protein
MAIELTFRVTKMSSDLITLPKPSSYNSVTLQAVEKEGNILNLCKAEV